MDHRLGLLKGEACSRLRQTGKVPGGGEWNLRWWCGQKVNGDKGRRVEGVGTA